MDVREYSEGVRRVVRILGIVKPSPGEMFSHFTGDDFARANYAGLISFSLADGRWVPGCKGEEIQRASSPDRYPICADQPAQIDCRRSLCRFHDGAGRCTNPSPAITLNGPPSMTNEKGVCWAYEEPEPEPTPEPPWADAPDWARQRTQDEDGTWRWWEWSPMANMSRWLCFEGETERAGTGIPNPNWRDTLQGRPEPELKPCPRCGKKMRMMPSASGGNYTWCEACNTRGPYRDTRIEAITAHNARKCPELDPCPFCGGEWRIYGDSAFFEAHCRGCGHRTKGYKTLPDLAADVNRRA